MPRSDTGRRDGYIPPRIPTRAAKPPAGPDWVHEIKHYGYRLQVRRVAGQVRLFTRRGYDWSGRCPSNVDTVASVNLSESDSPHGQAPRS
jgi:bifunctional non-homologous end joining protein LigD